MNNNRRKVVLGVSGIAAGTAAGLWPMIGSAQPSPAGPVRRRLNVASLPANHRTLVAYRRAIAAMKSLPSTNPRNWVNVARIHLNNCPHGNWYFLPWHRAYLLSFERICRDLSGDSDFTLPYWDWTANRQMPTTFTQPTFNGQPNQLYLPVNSQGGDPLDPSAPYRTGTPTNSLGDQIVGPNVISQIMSETSFESFGSFRPAGQNSTASTWLRARGAQARLEGTPHNLVHGFIGGTMGDFMSPLDPLFWLHHCNIDRIWNRWVRPPTFVNSNSPLWLNFRFSGHMLNANGSLWSPFVRDLLDVRNLGYTYDTILPNNPLQLRVEEAALPRALLPRFDPAQINFQASTLSADTVATSDRPMSIPLQLPGSGVELSTRALRIAPRAATTSSSSPLTLSGRVLAIVDAELLEGATTEMRIFLNCSYLSANTPVSDPHYVASVGFFPSTRRLTPRDQSEHSQHDNATRARFSFDLTSTLATLTASGITPEKGLELQVLPVPADIQTKAASVKVHAVQSAAV
jgi:tyrosinase